MKQSLFILSVTIILISGCVDSFEKERSAAALVAQKVHADKAEITFKDYKDTDNRNKKSILLTLGDFKNIPTDFSKDKITSTAALLYLKQFDNSAYKDYEEISVNLEDKFERTYPIKDMSDAETLFSVIQRFIDATNEKNFESIKIEVDANTIPDSTLQGIVNFINDVDSAYGKVNHIDFTGFAFDKVKETNMPVLVSWVQTKHANITTDFKFVVSRQNRKIIYVGVNEAD